MQQGAAGNPAAFCMVEAAQNGVDAGPETDMLRTVGNGTTMSLSEDDKQWMTAQFDARLEHLGVQFDVKLEHLNTQFDSKLEGLETRLTQQFDSKLEGLETRLTQQFDAKLEHLETTLLTEFHKWASPQDARMRTRTAVLRVIELDMKLSDRLTGLEPPQ
jgi:hypothetical protein